MKEKLGSSRLKYFVLLHFLVLFYSTSGILSKLAAKVPFSLDLLKEVIKNRDFLNENIVKFVLCYGGIVAVLGIYAIVWQQILKHINLTTAFCNKSAEMIWGILWGVLFFHEAIKWNMILGAVIVITGVIIVVTSDE